MRLLFETATDADTDCGCSHAIITLTPELADLMLRRIQALKTLRTIDASVYTIHCWSHIVDYVDYFDFYADGDYDESIEAALARQPAPPAYIELPDTYKIPHGTFESTECNQMIVYEDSIRFSAYPRHTSIVVRTGDIPLSLIEQVAATQEEPYAVHN